MAYVPLWVALCPPVGGRYVPLWVAAMSPCGWLELITGNTAHSKRIQQLGYPLTLTNWGQ